MEIEQSIYIVLSDTDNIEGEQIGIVTKETIDKLNSLVNQSEKLGRIANKLRDKTEQSKRHARKLLNRIVKSHGVKLDDNTQAVGISKEDDVIYVGEKNRIMEDPEKAPQFGDKLVGKITKYERRKYNELLDRYNYLAGKIDEHNQLVQINENSLISFEKSVLDDKEYDKEKQYLVVSSVTGKIFLVNSK